MRRAVTGKEPVLRGFELLAYSPNIRYETGDTACRTETEENRGTLARALAFGRCGVILTFTWHWFSSLGGWDKSFYSRTEFDPERVLQDGTPERTAFYRDPDVMAEHLKPFLLEDIPILWRPFHESEGIGSGGVKKVRRWRRGFSVCIMSILWENMVYIIFRGWGTASLWKGIRGMMWWISCPATAMRRKERGRTIRKSMRSFGRSRR